jgi:GNAT superfamily N-acetyltransferase
MKSLMTGTNSVRNVAAQTDLAREIRLPGAKAVNPLPVQSAGRLTGVVLIEQFDPATDPGRTGSCHQIATACDRLDDPGLPVRSLQVFTAWWTHGFGGSPRQTWQASDSPGGEVVGCYLLMLPDRENLAMADCTLYVAPGARRSGRGRELLAHCAGQARLAGRSRLVAETRDGSPGAAFAAALGATSGISEVLRVLAVDAALAARLAALRTDAEQRADGYTLLSWLGETPPEYLEDSARLSAAMVDAPRDEGVEPELWDADRIRRAEQTLIEAGQRLYGVAAMHEQSGHLAAITLIGTDPGTPGWGFQALTAVLPDHRGHRLGLLVKVAMLEQLLAVRPDVSRIVTGNAGANQHMIAINEELGFEVGSVHRRWELDLSAG